MSEGILDRFPNGPRPWVSNDTVSEPPTAQAEVVYTTAADNSLNPKTRYNVPLTPSSAGGIAMVPTLFFYQLGLVALVCVFLMLCWLWPNDAASPHQPIVPPSPPDANAPSNPNRLLA